MTTQEQYEEYINTPLWRSKVRERAKIDGIQCVMCGSRGTSNNPLECHHLTYHNLFNENIYKDLVTLCRSCHRSVHIMMNRITDAEGRHGWKDSLPMSNHVFTE